MTAAAAEAQTARAGESAPMAPSANTRVQEPVVRHEGGIPYVTGGIGESGEQQARALGRDMNLQLVFARVPSGSFVADADVTIADRNGNTVLQVNSANPLLFAQLDPGRYEVTATSQGRSIKRVINVPASGQLTEHFHWQAADNVQTNR